MSDYWKKKLEELNQDQKASTSSSNSNRETKKVEDTKSSTTSSDNYWKGKLDELNQEKKSYTSTRTNVSDKITVGKLSSGSGQQDKKKLTDEVSQLSSLYDSRKKERDSLVNQINIWENPTTSAAMHQNESVRQKNIEYLRGELAKYDDLEELGATLNQKKKQLKDSQDAEDFAKLVSVVNSKDFQKYSAIGKNIKNPEARTAVYINNPSSPDYGKGSELDSEAYETGNKVEWERAKGAGHIYQELTEEEVAIYNYYLGKGDKEAADRFLELMDTALKSRSAESAFKDLEGKTAAEILYGGIAGLDQFVSGVANLGNMVTGKDETEASFNSMLAGMVREDLGDVGPKILGLDHSLGQIGFDILNTGANMAPSIAVSALSNVIVPGSGAVVGSALMGGSASGNAYKDALSQGYEKEEARNYAILVGASEAALQNVLGGIGRLGGTSQAINKAVSGIQNGGLRFLAEYGGKIGSEALEEGLQEILDPLFKNAVMGADEDVDWEEVGYSALLGGFMGAGFGASEVKQSHLSNNEQKVVNRIYEDRVAREEKNGKVSNSKKSKIYEKVLSDMEKGRISADEIESVLGGESYNAFKAEQDKFFGSDQYKAYQKAVKDEKAARDEFDPLVKMKQGEMTGEQVYRRDELKKLLDESKVGEMKSALSPEADRIIGLRNQMRSQVMDMVKDSRLAESYRELERKSQKFEVDVSKYKNENAKKTVQSILDSGLGDNTNQFHETVDWLASLSEQKGITFDLTNNKKLKGTEHYKEGYITHGFVNENGDVMLNMDSDRVLETTVGHEITHVLEKAGIYADLSKAVRDFAISKEGQEAYNKRLADIKEIYGEDQTKIDSELTADIIGQYLFTDYDFVHNLSTQNRNVFQKIYDEIKYLAKLATAGSKEARDLEKVKKMFDKAWRENVEVSEATDAEVDDVRHSISVDDKKTLDFLNEQISRGEYDAETNPDGGYYVTYKSMSFWGYDEDGNAILRSPMAEYVDGELSNAYLIPKDKSKLNWYQSTETIDEKTGLPTGLLVKVKKDGAKSYSYVPAAENQDLIAEDWSNLYFNLRKKVFKNGKWTNSDVPARYNPYEHSSNSMLNDQFSAAYLRDNLVTVKMYVPVSEDNGAFRAKWSKDATGWTEWKSGTVAGKINQQKDLQRNVYLSRYAAPVEIVPDSEVAQAYKGYLEGTDVAIPDNVVSPNLLKELKNAGVPITESGKVQYSYSRPNFNKDEWSIVNRRKFSEFDNPKYDLDNGKKWMYAKEKGYTVFAIYSKSDAEDPTVMYGSSGKKAEKDYAKLNEFFEEWRSYEPNNKTTFDKILSDIKRAKGNTGDGLSSSGRRGTAVGDVYLPFGESRGNGTGDYGDGAENLQSTLTEYNDEASEESGASFVTFSNDYATIRNHMKDGDVSEKSKYSLSKTSELEIAYQYNLENEDMLGAEMAVEEMANLAMPDSKIRGKDGKLIPVYHGTDAMFWEFDTSADGGKNGTAEGFGIYLSDNQEVTNAYGDRQIKMFANITNPATSFKKTIKASTLAKLIKNTCQKEAQRMVEEDGYDSIKDAIRDTWVSNYVDTYSTSMEQAYREVALSMLQQNDNDKDVIHEVMFGMAIRSYDQAMEFYHNSLIPVTGIDGFVTKWENETTGESSNIYLAFDSSQLKSADPVTYDDSGNVIPLSERFNSEKKDIRYSFSKDNEGNQLTREQDDFFKDSKIRDRDGNLRRVYHTTQNDFTVFDKSRKGEATDGPNTFLGFFFAESPDHMTQFPEFQNGKTDSYYLDMKKPMDLTNMSKESFMDIVELTGGDRAEAAEIFDEELEAEQGRARLRGDNNTSLSLSQLLYSMVGDYYHADFFDALKPNYDKLVAKGYDGVIDYLDEMMGEREFVVFDSNQAKLTSNTNPTSDPDIRHSVSKEAEELGDGYIPVRDIGVHDEFEDFAPIRDDIQTTEESSVVGDEVTPTVSEMESVEEDDIPIKTVKERLTAKRSNSQTELDNNRRLRAEAAKSFDEKIAKAQAQLDSKKNKETKVANNIRRRIERLQRLKADVDAQYAKRISDVESRITKTDVELQKDHTKQDQYERTITRINRMLELEKADLDTEFAQKRESIADKNSYISEKASELYKEIRGLKKGVKASEQLGYLLDHGYDWSSIRSALVNIKHTPGEIVNINSEAESVAREMLEDDYEQAQFDLDEEYQTRLSEMESEAETKRQSAKVANQRMVKHKEYAEQMENLIGDTTTWVDKKMGISYKVNTLRRNLRDIVRDAEGNRDIAKADAIYDELQGKYNHNEAMLHREANQIKSPYADLKITDAEDAYIQMLGEFRHNPDTELTADAVKDFYEANKDKINTDKVDKVIESARATYDTLLQRVNEVLREQGMKEIPYRQGYFPHFTDPKQSWLAKLLNWKVKDFDIPTDIAGLTEQFNPNRSWQAFNKQRKSDTTDYSFKKGLDTYVQGALDWVYHIEDIQKRRAFENHIRYVHSEKGIQERIDAIRKNTEYDADEMQEQIDLIYKEAGNPLNNFVTDFRAGTNTLANKKSSLDRGMEELVNRKVYSTMTNLSNRVSGNMVAGSFSSALTNFIPITQSWVEVSPVSSLRAMGDTIKSAVRDDGTIDKSDFLTNRLRQSESLYQTNWDKISDKVGFLMEAIDSFTSQTVWRSKYLENISNGMGESEAIKNADQFAENVIAGRSRGNMPTIFDSKNPLIKTLTAFQLEVNNQYQYLLKDAPQDIKDKSAGKLIKGYATAFLGAYAYNALYSSLVGRDAAFDPIGILEDLFKDLFGDDDDEEPVDALIGLTDNILEEVPFVGGLLGGGRIPISSALPYDGVYEAFKGTVEDVANKDWKNLTNEWLNPLWYLAMPLGGGQLRKTVQGLSMFDDDLPISGSYTSSGKLRFPVEDTFGNRVKAGLFGQYASKNARDYFDNGRSPLGAEQIQEFIDVDIPIRDYWEYREGLRGIGKLGEKADYIDSLDLPIDKKNLLINNIADREDPIDLTGYGNYGSFEEFELAKSDPDKYRIAQAVGGYDAYQSFQKGMKDMTLAEKVDYVAGLNLTTKQKNALINGETDRKEPIDLTGYEDFDSFEEFEFAKKNPEKYQFFNDVGISYAEYDALDEDGKDAYTWAFKNPNGYTFSKAVSDDLLEYRRYAGEIYDIKADKDKYGKSISGTRKTKVIEYLQNSDLDDMAKIILYKSEYPADDTYNYRIAEYLIGRKDLTYEEKKTILEELDFRIDGKGNISW